jgi:hypothetical protein
MQEKILISIYATIDLVNANMRSKGRLKKNLNSIIFGEGLIDSMSFVFFVVSLEDNINDEFNTSIDLAGEGILILKNNPFRSIKTLVVYIEELLSTNEKS